MAPFPLAAVAVFALLALVSARPALLPGAVLSPEAAAAQQAAAKQVAASADQREFDYFMFVRQWPGGFCSQHSCPRLHTHGFQFTIHGLWPNYDDGKWPQFCNPSLPFKEASIDDLEDVMDTDWPSFMGVNTDFWAHEWNKHGTCAMHVMPSEHSYFKTVLDLNYRLDLSAAFRAGGIMPSNTRTYKGQDVRDAIYLLYGVDAQLHCGTDGTLMEVWMCVDKNLKPFKCGQAAMLAVDNCVNLRLPLSPSPGQGAEQQWLSSKHIAEGEEEARHGGPEHEDEAPEEQRGEEDEEVGDEYDEEEEEEEREEKHDHHHRHDDDDDDDDEERVQVGKMDPGEKEREQEKRAKEKAEEEREREEERREREDEKEEEKKGHGDHDHDHDHDGDDPDGPEVIPDTPGDHDHHKHHHHRNDDDKEDKEVDKPATAAVEAATPFIISTVAHGAAQQHHSKHPSPAFAAVPAALVVVGALAAVAFVGAMRRGLRAAAAGLVTSSRAGREAQLLDAACDPEAAVHQALLPAGEDVEAPPRVDAN